MEEIYYKESYFFGEGKELTKYKIKDIYGEFLVIKDDKKQLGIAKLVGKIPSLEIIVEPKYTDIKKLNDDLFAVRYNTSWKAINHHGEEIISQNYFRFMEAHDGYIRGSDGHKFDLYSSQGKLLLKNLYNYREFSPNSSYTIVCDETNHWVVIDREGNKRITIDNKQSFVGVLPNDLLVFDNYYQGVIDINLKNIIPFRYNKIRYVDEQRFLVKKRNKWFIIDHHNKKLTKSNIECNDISNFENGVARVKSKNESYNESYVVNDHLIRISKVYYEVSEFTDGVAVVKENQKFGLIDVNGQEILKPTYDYMLPFENGLSKVILIKNRIHLKGYIDVTGEVIIPVIYDSLSEFTDGVAYFKKGDTWGIITDSNEIIYQAKGNVDFNFLQVKGNLIHFKVTNQEENLYKEVIINKKGEQLLSLDNILLHQYKVLIVNDDYVIINNLLYNVNDLNLSLKHQLTVEWNDKKIDKLFKSYESLLDYKQKFEKLVVANMDEENKRAEQRIQQIKDDAKRNLIDIFYNTDQSIEKRQKVKQK